VSLVDEHGNPYSTENTDALALWERALDIFQTYNEDATPTVDQALEADPDFVMGHAFHAAAMLMSAEPRNRPKADERIATLNRLAPRANDRERGHIAALNAWAEGRRDRAQEAYGHVLGAYPRDAYALQIVFIHDIIAGDPRIMRDRVARVLPFWDATVRGHNFIQGLYAFALEEDGDYPRAEERGLHAWDLDNRDAWAVHAVAHVYEMEGRLDDGIAWMDQTWDHWKDGVFAVHNAWHTSLHHVERGDYARALDLHDTMLFQPQNDSVSELHDGAALLWRLTLFGVDVSGRWAEHLPLWQARTSDATFVFNDMHGMMALAACGDTEGQAALLATMEETARGESSNAVVTRTVGLPACRGIQAWAQGRHAEAVAALMPIRYRTAPIGGSKAQQDVIHLTLIEAALDAGDSETARTLAAERFARKPASPLNRAYMERAGLRIS